MVENQSRFDTLVGARQVYRVMQPGEEMMMRTILLSLSTLLTLNVYAAKPNSAMVKMPVKPLGNADAPVGGTFQREFSSEPETLNPISSSDFYGALLFRHTHDGLLFYNWDTGEYEPGLAESYELSKDNLVYTFHLRQDAKFHDGTPVTAEDVKFTFDVIKNPEYKAQHKLPYYENLDSIEVVDPQTVKFKFKSFYFKNLIVIADVGYTPIVPKHAYEDPKKKMNKEVIGSGAYKLETYDRGKSILLTRNNDWWGFKVPALKGMNKFEKILIRFIKEENLQLEMMKKGQLDFIEMQPEAYVQKTNEAPWGTDIIKEKVENLEPKSYNYVGWNMKNPMFKDRNVRVALAHLMNRDLMNEKFRFKMSFLETGPWYYSSPASDKSVKPVQFNPTKAKELLKKAGWDDKDKNGTLEKTVDGQQKEFRFELLLPTRDYEKYFTIYKEDLKKAGIEMNIKILEWNALVKALDEQKFDAVTLAWAGGDVEPDPKQIWHSESARAGGSNFISYSNPEVDKLIDEARVMPNKEKRMAIWKKVYRLIADDAPYVFMFSPRYALYGHSKKVQMSKPTLGYGIGYQYWWMGK